MKSFQYIVCLSFLMLYSLAATAQKIELLQQGKPASIRGLSVVNDKVAWVSGSRGYVAITTDGGKTWNWQQLKGYERSDFRDIEAFSSKEALIMSSGTPALVLKTTDGGHNWKECYQNTDTTYFLDIMDFETSKHGFILGDPINGKFLLLETKDGGDTWQAFHNEPDAVSGEAAFAASGTCLRVINGIIGISSGGAASHFISLKLHDDQAQWNYSLLPFSNKKPSQGAFSFAQNKTQTLFVGGDYANDKRADSVACIAQRNDQTYSFPAKGPAGYQSCAEAVTDKTFLSTGTSGSNITTDDGVNWVQIDTISYNVCRKAKHGKLVLLAGDKGRIGIYKP